MLVGMMTLPYLRIYSGTLLDRNWSKHFGPVVQSSTNGPPGRLIIERLYHRMNRKSTKRSCDEALAHHGLRGDYFSHKYDQDPFPDPSLINPDDKKDEKLLRNQISEMVDKEQSQAFPEEHVAEPHSLVWKYSTKP